MRIPRLALLLAATTIAAQVAVGSQAIVMAIGDSLSEEYAFELPFSAPASNPAVANVRNWVEILHLRRAADFNFGEYKSSYLEWGDLRNSGYRYNFGIPGFTTSNWYNLITGGGNSTTDPFLYLYPTTRNNLRSLLQTVPPSVVVILIGGNDLKQDYDAIFNGTEAADFYSSLVSRIAYLHDVVRWWAPGMPVIISTLPDVGMAPSVADTYSDPVRRASARAKIAALNDQVRAMAAGRGATVADIAALGLVVDDTATPQINGTPFIKAGDPENPPNYLFCRDGFHPSTATQTFIANTILQAVNQATSRSIAPLANREILQNVLGLDPDRPFHDWIAGYSVGGNGANDDPDHDGLSNLTEFALGTNPAVPNGSTFTGSILPGNRLALSFLPPEVAGQYLTIGAQTSADLTNWSPAGVTLETLTGGTRRASIPCSGPRGYLRFILQPAP